MRSNLGVPDLAFCNGEINQFPNFQHLGLELKILLAKIDELWHFSKEEVMFAPTL